MPLIFHQERGINWAVLENSSEELKIFFAALVHGKLSKVNQKLSEEDPLYAWENEVKNHMAKMAGSAGNENPLVSYEEWQVYKIFLEVKLEGKKSQMDDRARRLWQDHIDIVEGAYIKGGYHLNPKQKAATQVPSESDDDGSIFEVVRKRKQRKSQPK